MKNILLPVCVCSCLLSGCDSDGDTVEPNSMLEANDWQLHSYGFEVDEKVGVLDNTSYKLTFSSPSQVSGNIDCNSFVSDYKSSNSTFSIDQLAVTEMACALVGDQDYTTQSEFIIDALTNAQQYSISDSKLIITSIDSAQLIFSSIEN